MNSITLFRQSVILSLCMSLNSLSSYLLRKTLGICWVSLNNLKLVIICCIQSSFKGIFLRKQLKLSFILTRIMLYLVNTWHIMSCSICFFIISFFSSVIFSSFFFACLITFLKISYLKITEEPLEPSMVSK